MRDWHRKELDAADGAPSAGANVPVRRPAGRGMITTSPQSDGEPRTTRVKPSSAAPTSAWTAWTPRGTPSRVKWPSLPARVSITWPPASSQTRTPAIGAVMPAWLVNDSLRRSTEPVTRPPGGGSAGSGSPARSEPPPAHMWVRNVALVSGAINEESLSDPKVERATGAGFIADRDNRIDRAFPDTADLDAGDVDRSFPSHVHHLTQEDGFSGGVAAAWRQSSARARPDVFGGAEGEQHEDPADGSHFVVRMTRSQELTLMRPWSPRRPSESTVNNGRPMTVERGKR